MIEVYYQTIGNLYVNIILIFITASLAVYWAFKIGRLAENESIKKPREKP